MQQEGQGKAKGAQTGFVALLSIEENLFSPSLHIQRKVRANVYLG